MDIDNRCRWSETPWSRAGWGAAVERGCWKQGTDKLCVETKGPGPGAPGDSASLCFFIPHHFLLLWPPPLFSFRVPPMPGPAGPPRQLNRFISLSLKHFGLPRWLRQKNLPAVQETWVRSLGGEDPLEKEMAPHSSILAWRIPWTEEPGGLQSTGSQRVGHD